jgi:hypothetical protein
MKSRSIASQSSQSKHFKHFSSNDHFFRHQATRGFVVSIGYAVLSTLEMFKYLSPSIDKNKFTMFYEDNIVIT